MAENAVGMNVYEELKTAKQLQKTLQVKLEALKASVYSLTKHVNNQDNLSEINPIHDEHFQAILQTMRDQNQLVSTLLKYLYTTLSGLVKILTSQLKGWQKMFQLFYAKLGHLPDPKVGQLQDLESIAHCCGETGQILHELLAKRFEEWKKNFEIYEDEEYVNDCKTQLQTFRRLFENFLQSTFIVTEQEEFCIRTLKKSFPTIRIRVLAAAHVKELVGEVTAYFVSECNLRQCVHEDGLKIGDLEKKQIRVKNVATSKKQKSPQKLEFTFQKDTQTIECVCKNLTFEETFKRPQNKETRVHEEKFRIVFLTQIMSQTILTLSLPLVVISASNQEVNSLASIMWQCFSTNVFSIDNETPAEMNFSSVIEMLKSKLSFISKFHYLTESNIRHFKRQLFGDENKPDDALVSLSQFCCDHTRQMKNITSTGEKKMVQFSFWKWFLGAFNVIEDYLLPYWNDGLIMGFESRQNVQQMLLKCKASGTFILRFSDTEIRDRDGVKNVHGRLKASVFCIKFSKPRETGKKCSASQQESCTEKVIEDLDLSDPPENLANILKDEKKHLYRFLYPGVKTREELFDKYYKTNTDMEKMNADYMGYKKPSDVGLSVTDLEQALKQINIIAQSSPQAPEDVNVSEPRVIKKARRKSENLNFGESLCQVETYGNFDTNEQRKNLFDSDQKPYTSQSSENSSMSPSYMEQSPEQSVPSLTYPTHFRNDVSGDSVVPNSHDNSANKDVREGSYASGVKNGTRLYYVGLTNENGTAAYRGINQSENDFNLSIGGACTPERFDQGLIGNDILMIGPDADVRTHTNTDPFVNEEKLIECKNQQSLENNSKLTVSSKNELRQLLTQDQYNIVLSWTQSGSTLQATQGQEASNEDTNTFISMDIELGLEIPGHEEDIDQILQGIESNMSMEEPMPDLGCFGGDIFETSKGDS